jgi:hypothetical protein
MLKKILIALAIALVAGLAIKHTWAGSHMRLSLQKWATAAKKAVPLEREIERLQMELNHLSGQDERFLDKVAHQALAVEKLETQIANLKKDLAQREAQVRAMHVALATKDAQVIYNGERYTRDTMEQQLKIDFLGLEADEQVLHSRTEHLMELKKSLLLHRRKLSELKVQRERMATELQRLETAVAVERRIKREEESSIDDTQYRKLAEEIAAVRDQVQLLKTKRELRNEMGEGPVRAQERQREEEAKLRQRMAERFANRQ